MPERRLGLARKRSRQRRALGNCPKPQISRCALPAPDVIAPATEAAPSAYVRNHKFHGARCQAAQMSEFTILDGTPAVGAGKQPWPMLAEREGP